MVNLVTKGIYMKYKTLILASVWAFNTQAQKNDWSGCYIGASASILESSNQWTTDIFQGEVLNENAGSADADDEAIGIQFGCNFLESEDWVFGAKILATDNKLNASHLYIGGRGADNFLSYETEDVVSIIGRIGFKASDNGLIYGNLGYTQSSHVYTDTAQTPFVFSFRNRESQRGILLGVGYEHMLSNEFSIFAEYNYTDLGDNNVMLEDLIAPPTEYRANIDQDLSQFNLGINFNF